MGENCVLTACEHRRGRPLQCRRGRAADGVDALVDWVQATDTDSILDGLRTEAELEQLSPGHVAMLAPCELGDPSID